MRRIVPLLVVAAFLPLGACANKRRPDIEAAFTGMGVVTHHNQYYARFDLRPGTDWQALGTAVAEMLRRERGSVAMQAPVEFDASLRACDWWALALAELVGVEFKLTLYDSYAVRDRKIESLLETLKAPGEPDRNAG